MGYHGAFLNEKSVKLGNSLYPKLIKSHDEKHVDSFVGSSTQQSLSRANLLSFKSKVEWGKKRRKNRSIQDYKLTRLNWECYEKARYNDSTVKCVYFSFDHTYQYTSKWKEDVHRPKSAPYGGCKRAEILSSWLQAIHSVHYREEEWASSTDLQHVLSSTPNILANPDFTIHVVENSNQHVIRVRYTKFIDNNIDAAKNDLKCIYERKTC